MTAPSGRSRVRRVPRLAVYDRAAIDGILDEALVSHLGFVDRGQPFVIPTVHARVGDELYVHGAAASRMIKTLTAGVPVCLTATLVDGIVLARSAFNHSMRYRSVVVLGTARLVEPESERLAALEAFTEQMVPGRWPDVRPPSRQELKATRVLALPLDEASAKTNSGPVLDRTDDYALPVWAGVIPLRLERGDAQPDARLSPGAQEPDYVRAWRR